MDDLFSKELENALDVLRSGGVILYPTDTIWGIGCDATNREAIDRIYKIKEREDSKSMIILVADEKDILKHVAAPHPEVFDFIEKQDRPTTIIFEQAIGLPANLLAADGSVGIRMVKDEFCRHLIKRLRHPLVSTSANISGTPSPANYQDVSMEIRNRVDYIVHWRQEEIAASQPSRIVKWNNNGDHILLRG